MDRDDPTRFEVAAAGMVVPVVFRSDGNGQVMCLGHPMLSTLRKRPWWQSSRVRLRALAAAGAAGATFKLSRRPRER